jgi:hypothetical protein
VAIGSQALTLSKRKRIVRCKIARRSTWRCNSKKQISPKIGLVLLFRVAATTTCVILDLKLAADSNTLFLGIYGVVVLHNVPSTWYS